jgi:hypothetical protein
MQLKLKIELHSVITNPNVYFSILYHRHELNDYFLSKCEILQPEHRSFVIHEI